MANLVSDSNRSAKSEEILKLAFEIFYREGFHATGVDTILENSGISKRTLYKHFGSKEALIKATIQYFHQHALDKISEFVNKKSSRSPLEKPLRLLDYVIQSVESGDLRGCYAMNAKSEYANRDENIESVCDGYSDAVEKMLEATIKEAGYAECKKLASQIAILYRGAVLTCQSRKSAEPALAAKAAAKVLLSQARLR